jgi:protein phosphatase
MDRIAVFSDVHGNITALNAVLNDIRSKNISKIICLGDHVLKCANPDLVIDCLKQNCDIIIKGNCDDIISKPESKTKGFWTRKKIGDERADFLANLPVFTEFYLSGHLIRLFHASPFSLEHLYNPVYPDYAQRNPEITIKNPEDLFQNTAFLGKTKNDLVPDIIGYSHIHTPNLFRYKNKTIFNTGSVGIPVEMYNKDPEDPNNKFSTMASYIILEGEYDSKELSSVSFTFVRIPYDIQKEIEYLERSNMPTKDVIIQDLKTAIHRNY